MRIWNSRKAVSGSISAMFIVILFLLIASSLLSYRFAEARYNSLVNDRSQRDWERYNERLVIPSAVRNGTGTVATLNATIQNVGAVSAHLVTLFLSAYDSRNSPRLQLQYAISIWMGPGNISYHFGQAKYHPSGYNLMGQSQAKPTVGLPYDSFTYVIKIVTERGNVVTFEIESQKAEGWQTSQVVMSAGTMEIKYGSTGWKRPRILYSDLQLYANAYGSDSSRLRIRAKFINNGQTAVYVKSGTIQFQTCWGSPNAKVKTFGGSFYSSAPIILAPGTPVLLEFKIDSDTGSWPSTGELFITSNCDQVAFVSYAGLVSSWSGSEQDFFSAAVLVDAICVYRII